MAIVKKPAKKMQMGGGTKPMMKKGGSFPDLNKDGKITKADILKGRGVIAKKGMMVKAQAGKMQKITKGKSGAPSPKFQMEMEKMKYQRDMDRMKLDREKAKEEALRPKGLAVGTAKKGAKMTKKCAYGCK